MDTVKTESSRYRKGKLLSMKGYTLKQSTELN